MPISLPAPCTSYSDVIGRLRALDDSLPDPDGVRWFARLYRLMTEAVASATEFENPAFIERLDCLFADLFFAALATFEGARAETPAAWWPMLKARHRSDLTRLQYALAGVNAHINRDLCVALERTFRFYDQGPVRGSARHRDYQKINIILGAVLNDAKAQLFTPPLLEIDALLGTVDDTAELFSLTAARDAAWVGAEVRWALRDNPKLQAEQLRVLDHGVGLASRGLLRPLLRGR